MLEMGKKAFLLALFLEMTQITFIFTFQNTQHENFAVMVKL